MTDSTVLEVVVILEIKEIVSFQLKTGDASNSVEGLISTRSR